MRRALIPPARWADPRHRQGLEAELQAARYLESCGYEIEHHRFRVGRHDIDVIARRSGVVAFVEVKSRRGGSAGLAATAVGSRKQRILVRMADYWRIRYGRRADIYRFDVVVVRRLSGRWIIDHFTDAFRPSPGRPY